MKRKWLREVLALLLALALCLPAAMAEDADGEAVAGLPAEYAEELGEMDLYDPAIYDGVIEPDAPQPVAPSPATDVPPASDDTAETPANVTDAPANTTEMPADTTDAPANTTETPADTTDAPANTTDAPADTTEAPADATVTPADATDSPADTTETPADATETSADTTEAPADTKEAAPADDSPAPDATAEAETTGEGVEVESTGEAAEATPDEASAEAEPTDEPLADADAAVAAPEANLRLGVGEQYILDGASLLGGDGVAQYASDLPEIASVDAAGLITANGLGTAQITVTGNGGGTALFVVAVLNAPDALLFPAGELTLGKGERRPWAASLPENTASATITYSVDKPKLLQVDAAGNLVAKKTGTVRLTATAYNGAQAVCVVRVLRAPSRVKLSAKTAVLCVGESRALTATLSNKSTSLIVWSSDNPGVVAVDANGTLTGVAPGTATVAAQTFNNKRATCKVVVLDGAPPTVLSLNATDLVLGAKEQFRIVPAVGAGEAAVYGYATSAKRVATVTADGLITAKKAGTAIITVATHNGVQAQVRVTVGKAPKKVSISPSSLTIEVGKTGQLSAVLPAGAASSIVWESSDPAVATVGADGVVTGVSGGGAFIRARTFNNKTALCMVTVTDVSNADIPQPEEEAEPEEATPTSAQMAANLRSSSALGGKRDAIANVVKLLVDNGFEPAFAAGVGANIYSEGTYGLFESSKYVSNYQKRPRYFCYLDGGYYYTQKNGSYVVSAVYLSQEEMDAYTGSAEVKLRFGEKNFYLDNYSGKYVQNVSLGDLEKLLETLAEGGWQGKFGLGVVQWTGARTKKLVSFYREQAGPNSDSLTAEQVVAAENRMILSELKGKYAGVYNTWRSDNSAALSTADAAYSAGSIVCLKYEIPANKESKAVTRGNKAKEIYNIMMGV